MFFDPPPSPLNTIPNPLNFREGEKHIMQQIRRIITRIGVILTG